MDRFVLAIVLCSGLLSVGCSRRAVNSPTPPDSSAPNLLIITIDTLRADHLGCYGYFRDTSPTIDALAAEAVVFDRCLAPVAQTLPTHMSLFTGVYPIEHGFQANMAKWDRRWTPSPTLVTFATVLAKNGYATAGFISAEPIKKITGMADGFSVWSEPDTKHSTADDTTLRVTRWLATGPAEPFMLWVHYFDAHAPYEPPPPYDTMYRTDDALEAYLAQRRFSDTAPKRYRSPRGKTGIRIKHTRADHNLYDGEVRFIDDQLGKLFESLRTSGHWQGLSILLTSDHGEALGQHGREGHGHVWYEQMHVPLLMRVPGSLPKRVAAPLSTVDILPTFLALSKGIPAERLLDQCVGSNVLKLGMKPRPIYGQMPAGHKPDKIVLRSIMQDGWRFILDPADGDKLFNLAVDPYELRNQVKEQPAKADNYRKTLQRIVLDQTKRGRQNQAGRMEQIDPRHRRNLQTLGYTDEDDS